MARRLRIAAVGEVTEDVVLPAGQRLLGGISANFARWAARAGAESALYAPVGADPAGARVRAALAAGEIAGLRVRVLPGSTAVQNIRRAADGERIFCGFAAGVLLDYRLTDSELAELAEFDALAVPCAPESRAVFHQCLELARNRRPLVAADFSQESPIGAADAPASWVEPYLDRVQLAFVGGRPEFTETLLPLTRGRDALIVLTAGPAGAFALHRGRSRHQPTLATTIVDTTGCGDAFQAGFTVAFASGAGVAAALRAGARLAARAAAIAGAA